MIFQEEQDRLSEGKLVFQIAQNKSVKAVPSEQSSLLLENYVKINKRATVGL